MIPDFLLLRLTGFQSICTDKMFKLHNVIVQGVFDCSLTKVLSFSFDDY